MSDKTKEDILEALENKTQQELAKDYVEAENKLLKKLHTLKNGDVVCDCEDVEEVVVAGFGDEHYGSEYVMNRYCLNCGGEITEQELY